MFYSFDDLLKLMIDFNFSNVDKKNLDCDKLCVVGRNEQVFITDGVNIDVRAVVHDECFVSMDGAFQLMELNMFGDKERLERVIVECTYRVIKVENHPWQERYIKMLRSRIKASFDIYFKVLEQYMLSNQPQINKIINEVTLLVEAGEKYKNSCDYRELIVAHNSFEKACVLMMKQM